MSRQFDAYPLAVPGIRDLAPYDPGKPIEELEREYGVSGAIKVASNENPYGPSPVARQVLANEISDLARYPDGAGFAGLPFRVLVAKIGGPSVCESR